MKLLLPLLGLAVSTTRAIPGKSCLDLARSIINVDVEKVAGNILTKVCGQGLEPNLSELPELGGVYSDQIFQLMAAESGLGRDSGLVAAYQELANAVIELTPTSCGHLLPSSGSLCEDAEKRKSFVKCVTGQVWPVGLTHAPRLLRVMGQGVCKTQAEAMSSGRVLEEIVPEVCDRYIQDMKGSQWGEAHEWLVRKAEVI